MTWSVVRGSLDAKTSTRDVDILPVADPNIFSQTQRGTLAQTELQLASSQPQMHNLYNAYRQMYEALGVKILIVFCKTCTSRAKDRVRTY